MAPTQTPSEIAAYLATRDLRYYGLWAFDNRDAAVLCAEAAKQPYDAEQQDKVVAIYASVLPTMTAMEQGEVLAKARRCPVRPPISL